MSKRILSPKMSNRFVRQKQTEARYVNARLTHTRDFVNLTGKDLQVSLRNGLVIKIPKIPTDIRGFMIIYDTYSIPQENVYAVGEQLGLLATENDTELKIMKSVFDTVYFSRSITGGMVFTLETLLYLKDIEDENGCIYLIDKDVVITIANHYDEAEKHPYAQFNIASEKFRKLNEETSGLNFHIELVDNDCVIGERFFCFNGKPMLIRPVKDENRVSGGYLFIQNTIPGLENAVSERVELDQLEEKLGLYKTEEDAITAGNSQILFTNKITELQRQISEDNLKITQTKNEYELELLNAKRKMTELEAELRDKKLEEEKLKLEFEKTRRTYDETIMKLKEEAERKKYEREDYYDEKSHRRKESTEYIKMLPALISLAAVLVAIFK